MLGHPQWPFSSLPSFQTPEGYPLESAVKLRPIWGCNLYCKVAASNWPQLLCSISCSLKYATTFAADSNGYPSVVQKWWRPESFRVHRGLYFWIPIFTNPESLSWLLRSLCVRIFGFFGRKCSHSAIWRFSVMAETGKCSFGRSLMDEGLFD